MNGTLAARGRCYLFVFISSQICKEFGGSSLKRRSAGKGLCVVSEGTVAAAVAPECPFSWTLIEGCGAGSSASLCEGVDLVLESSLRKAVTVHLCSGEDAEVYWASTGGRAGF